MLGLVGLNGVQEGRVVSGMVGGDLAVEEIDVAGCGDYGALGVIAGHESGVVAVDDGAGGNFRAGAWREM